MQTLLMWHPDFRSGSKWLMGLIFLWGCVVMHATSLWDENVTSGRSMYADQKAFQKGDLVTIIVNQSTVATKDQETKTSKVTSENESFQALWGPFLGGVRGDAEATRRNPHNLWGGTRTFTGNGSVKNNETVTSTVQARITDVMPNRVLRVEASRRVEVGQETSYVILTGLIRQQDLTAANSVLSTQVADLEFKQVTNGSLSREQRKGWLTRVWETVAPF